MGGRCSEGLRPSIRDGTVLPNPSELGTRGKLPFPHLDSTQILTLEVTGLHISLNVSKNIIKLFCLRIYLVLFVDYSVNIYLTNTGNREQEWNPGEWTVSDVPGIKISVGGKGVGIFACQVTGTLRPRRSPEVMHP